MFPLLGTDILQQTLAVKQRNILISQLSQALLSSDTLGGKLSYSCFQIYWSLEGSLSFSKLNLSEKHLFIYLTHT